VGERQGTVLSEQPPRRKLIEVSLPLEAINRESAREKSIRHGHPSTLHLWWARRPLAAARAVLFAQLVDDPSSHPEEFPTEEAQQAERERLHKIIERLVVWENISDEKLYAEAHEEILKSTGGNPPPILDPFAGGGSIPLEAQRLGLEAHASDLNPVAVLINKALIEIPPKFADRPPVFPGLAETQLEWKGAEGLAADVRAYGEWMREEAEEKIGEHYPKAKLPDGSEATVIAWIWARTVTCPNPACGIEMPLVRSWWLGKKRGKEAYVVPRVVEDAEQLSGKHVEFEIGHDVDKAPSGANDGTVDRNGARCAACGSVASLEYVRESGREGRLGEQLMAIVAEGHRQRMYLPPSDEHRDAALSAAPADRPRGDLPDEALGFRVQAYGMTEWADLFTNRQLLALTTFSDIVGAARERVLAEARSATGFLSGDLPAKGDDISAAYGDAIATYASCALVRVAMTDCSLCRWNSTGEKVQHMFGRQAISMVWDFPEIDPFASSTGSWRAAIEMVVNALNSSSVGVSGIAEQEDATQVEPNGDLLSTDPPYYDNVGYADLSDFFYVWLRRSLRNVYPGLLKTMLVPKVDELVANPYRHEGRDGARKFFEQGFREVFAKGRSSVLVDLPITVYYAFKQSDVDQDGEASTGWETLLDGMIRSGWAVTATWPVRTEMATRMRAQSANALASSIVLALRPRPDDAPSTDRRGLVAALQKELPHALRDLQQGAIGPVDLPQAAIGPGMAVFSSYSSVIEADGSPMSVRSALARINEILDQVLNEQEGDFDPTTRFGVAWYRQHGYGTGKFGDANNLANARNTSVETMARAGILTSAGGKVTLLVPGDLPKDYDPLADERISTWEVLHHMIAALDRAGIDEAARLLATASSRPEDPVDADLVKELAFLLFSLAEKNGWTQDAVALNTLATSWPEIVEASRNVTGRAEQVSLDLGS
jgi:putative DNA methylase